jgi:hypothetical protein
MPSPAMVVALIALFVALSGRAYATTQALRPRGLQGPAGPQGAPGANGANGANGGFDPNKVSYVTGPATTMPANDIGTATATCPSNTIVIGGGFYTSIGIPADSQTFSGNS